MEDTASGPGLRNVGPAWIKNWKIYVALALYARKNLRWSIRVKAVYGIKYTPDYMVRFICQSVAFKPVGNDAIILGPDRTKLVEVWIVRRIIAGDGANAPAAPHIFLQEPLSCAFCLVLIGNSTPQNLPGIRGNLRNLLLV